MSLLKKKSDIKSVTLNSVFLEKDTYELLEVLATMNEYDLQKSGDESIVFEQLFTSLLSKKTISIKPKVSIETVEIKKLSLTSELMSLIEKSMKSKNYDPSSVDDLSYFLNTLLKKELMKNDDIKDYVQT